MTAAELPWECCQCPAQGITNTSATHHITATNHAVIHSHSGDVGGWAGGEGGAG